MTWRLPGLGLRSTCADIEDFSDIFLPHIIPTNAIHISLESCPEVHNLPGG